ncbi:MAG: DUF3592 domain-containing protein [Chloroflexota bacterium]
MDRTLVTLFVGFSCIAVVFLAVIAVVVLFVLNQKRSKQKTVIDANWPSVSGKIISTELDVDDDANVIAPVVSFEYTVNGQVFKSSQVVGRPNSLKSKALKTLELYPLDSEIIVHYNSADPKKARVSLR